MSLLIRDLLNSVKNVRVLADQRMPFSMCLFRVLKEKALKMVFPIYSRNFHFQSQIPVNS